MRRDRPPTPGTVIRMAYDGFGVDDIHVRTGYAYAHIATILENHPNGARLQPWAKLARQRSERLAA